MQTNLIYVAEEKFRLTVSEKIELIQTVFVVFIIGACPRNLHGELSFCILIAAYVPSELQLLNIGQPKQCTVFISGKNNINNDNAIS